MENIPPRESSAICIFIRAIWSCPINVVCFSAEVSSRKLSDNETELSSQQSVNYKTLIMEIYHNPNKAPKHRPE
uniref:Uncharacterized protein n=1 Tax=Arundo donax TaxID=35708 RepID=A0A0A9H0Y7_ARUDO